MLPNTIAAAIWAIDDVPMSAGNLNDGLIALKDGKMVTLRIPYPRGLYGWCRR